MEESIEQWDLEKSAAEVEPDSALREDPLKGIGSSRGDESFEVECMWLYCMISCIRSITRLFVRNIINNHC